MGTQSARRLSSPAWLSSLASGLLLVVSCLCVCGIVAPQAARGQSMYYAQAAGRPTFNTPETVPEGFVDLANGDLHIEIPLSDPTQRGSMSTNARMVYDSRIWEIVDNGTSKSWQPANLTAPGFGTGGWRRVYSDNAASGGADSALNYCGSNYTEVWGPFYSYTGDGTLTFFPATTQQDFGCGNQNIPTASTYAQDSTGSGLSVTNYADMLIRSHDGTEVANTASSGFASEDSNGNDFTYNSNTDLVDTLGRVPLARSCSSNTCTFTVPNASGGTSSYTVTYDNLQVDTNFGVTGVTEYSGDIWVVLSIAFPDGTSYTFSYDDGSTPGHYGEMNGMALRTGGHVSYSWSNFTDSYGNVVRWLTGRSFAGGTWSYSPSVVSSCSSTEVGCQQEVTETKPSGDEAVYTFTLNNGAWNTETQYYSGSSTLLKTVTTSYDFSNSCPDCGGVGDAYIRPTKAVTTLDNDQQTQTTYAYDSIYYGNVTAKKEWPYTTGGFGSTPNREWDTTYLNSSAYIAANILNRPTDQITYQNGTKQAETRTSYDSTPLTSVTGVVQHDDTNYGTGNTVRGNPTTVSLWVSGSAYLTTTNDYDTTGQLVQTADPAGNTTAYSYADNFVNGSPSGPTNAYQTEVTLPVSGTIQYSYYFGTGQRASATDQNGQTATYQFADPLNRPTETEMPDGAWTLTTYTGATEVDQYRNVDDTTPSSSCSSCVHTETLLDSWGQLASQVLDSDPAGATKVGTTFDAQARLTSKTNPYRSTSDPTYGSTSYAYDGLDRQLAQTDPDGNVAYTYYGSAVTGAGGIGTQLCSNAVGYPTLSVDEAGDKQETWTNVFGNPVEIDQENSSGTLSLATCYGYNALNDLINVTQGGQTRAYAYDGLGRETSQTTPEAGTVDYDYTTASGGLCAGDSSKVCSRTDARAITTTYSYDALSRLTEKSYSDSTPAAYYYYDETDTTVSNHYFTLANGKGRLTHTSTDGGLVNTVESYNPAGRVADFWQCTPYYCPDGIFWQTQYDHTPGGYVSDYSSPANYTITYSISNAGEISSITSSLNDSEHPSTLATIAYAPQGTPATITNGCAGSGCTEVQQAYVYNNRLQLNLLELGTSSSPSSMACWVYNYYASLGNPTSCAAPSEGQQDDGSVLGTYYQDSVNTGLDHTATYSYDPTHRLTSAVATGSSTYNLAYSFDQHGNVTCTQNQNTQGPCPQYEFSSSTNQVTNSGYTYDASGDLTDNSTHSYQYDAEGRLISVDNGSTATYLYNSFGERVESHVGSDYKEYIYDKDGNQVGYMDRSGPAWNSWVVFNNQHLAHYENSGTYFMHANSQGTAAFVTDYSGSVVQDELHYPWGEVWQVAGTQVEERYAGMEHQDSETGLDPTPNRMYSSVNYTWLSPDPAQADIFQPQSMSAYSYAGDNPFTFTDVTGLAHPCLGQPGLGVPEGTYVLCATASAPGYNPVIALFTNAFIQTGVAYLVSPDLYLGLGGFAVGVITGGAADTVFAAIGGYAGAAGGLLSVSNSVVGQSPITPEVNTEIAQYNIGAGIATGNYVQVAAGAAAWLGQEALSQSIEVGEQIDESENEPEALPLDTGAADYLMDLSWLC